MRNLRNRRQSGYEWTNVTVTYKRKDGNFVTNRRGIGRTYVAALWDADRQLKDGVWTRLVCSTSESIATDLLNSHSPVNRRRKATRGEGVTIRVEHHVSEVLETL